ncbi:MAG: hypothetical protein WBX25_24140 [Rhodomicrobium sp.]
MKELPYHPKFQCCASFLNYDFIGQQGFLYLPDANCTDMGGCIEVFKAIDPAVKRIYVWEAGALINIYEKRGKKWSCRSSARNYQNAAL